MVAPAAQAGLYVQCTFIILHFSASSIGLIFQTRSQLFKLKLEKQYRRCILYSIYTSLFSATGKKHSLYNFLGRIFFLSWFWKARTTVHTSIHYTWIALLNSSYCIQYIALLVGYRACCSWIGQQVYIIWHKVLHSLSFTVYSKIISNDEFPKRKQ